MKKNQYKNFYEIKPAVGNYITAENWHSALLECDDWDMAEFRLTGNFCQPAANVEVTGRTLQWPEGVSGGAFVRVKITFVADKGIDWYTGEIVGKDVIVSGWLKVDETNIVSHN